MNWVSFGHGVSWLDLLNFSRDSWSQGIVDLPMLVVDLDLVLWVIWIGCVS